MVKYQRVLAKWRGCHFRRNLGKQKEECRLRRQRHILLRSKRFSKKPFVVAQTLRVACVTAIIATNPNANFAKLICLRNKLFVEVNRSNNIRLEFLYSFRFLF